ncbi:MAG: hypothetical protein JSW64_07265 [Candidatus Zixiibacteriota bacterium]|nr:MAG: hypothetical protein JSW64_07265 [candidate division Zixibacteria bacterium]
MNGQENNKNVGYEKRDISTKKVLFWGIAGIIIVVIIIVALVEYFLLVKERYYHEYVEKPRSEALIKLREREKEELTGYKLLDEEKGIYRIPIERAMELAVDEASSKNTVKK